MDEFTPAEELILKNLACSYEVAGIEDMLDEPINRKIVNDISKRHGITNNRLLDIVTKAVDIYGD